MTGTGTSSVLLSATANPSNEARTGTLSVNSVPAAVLQNGQLGAPLFWIKTLAPPTVTLSNGTARCVLDLDNESTATPAFVGMALYFSNQRIASAWNAGDVFTLDASAPATPVWARYCHVPCSPSMKGSLSRKGPNGRPSNGASYEDLLR